MRFASLGSGSGGNALVCNSGKTTILLDCGFGIYETQSRLARLNLLIEQIRGIVVTHEHADHVQGIARIARRYKLAIWLTYGTWRMIEHSLKNVEVNLIEADSPFFIGDLNFVPFTVPHDAREPVQFVVSDGDKRLGILTDTGRPTEHIENILTGLDALVLECNHDEKMLQESHYPLNLKRRIGGPYGHMSNADAARLLANLDFSRLSHLIAAHLSEKNNTPALARAALATVLDCEKEWINVASQDKGFNWLTI
ncbi:MAG: MBL fold metallo-hydrolase [Proteobacteria bacterium]|nr:MBL fold metallo-hydrolase [Pseudomonadota bacterium]